MLLPQNPMPLGCTGQMGRIVYIQARESRYVFLHSGITRFQGAAIPTMPKLKPLRDLFRRIVVIRRTSREEPLTTPD